MRIPMWELNLDQVFDKSTQLEGPHFDSDLMVLEVADRVSYHQVLPFLFYRAC